MSTLELSDMDTVNDRPARPVQYTSCFSIPLSPAELREHQRRYLDMETYKYGLPARLLFWTAGKVFPQGRSFEFFAFVELVARVPYMAWEHVGHIAQTQTHRDHEFGRKIQDRVYLARDEQDNEFWHLLIMEDALFVEEHPEFDEMTWESKYRGDYGFHATVGDMLRQIAVDEEQHKDHSEDYIARGARFSRRNG